MNILKIIYYFLLKSIFFVDKVFRTYNIDIYYPYSKLKKYKDIHKGKRCFIIGTGPSLNINDLKLLKNEYTFSMNSIILSFKDTSWRPTYYAIQDGRAYNIFKNQLLGQGIKEIFLGISYRRKSLYLNKLSNKDFLKYNYFPLKIYKKYIREISFSDDCYKEVYDGSTITYSIMQLAVYMGFKEIYLLGIDCDYTSKGKKNIIDYVKNTNGIDVENKMLFAYTIAKRFADKNGVKIINLNQKGKLDIFDRKNLRDVIK